MTQKSPVATAMDMAQWLADAELLTCKVYSEDDILITLRLIHAEHANSELEFEVHVAGGIHDAEKRWLIPSVRVSHLIETRGAALVEEINRARELALAARAETERRS